MVEEEVVDPLNSRLLNRRDSSQTDHVNRIRTAALKRRIVPWWETQPKVDKEEMIDPSNVRLRNRRDSSLENHVRRIRTAPLKRRIVPWWETQPKVSKEVMDPLNLSLRTRRDRSLTDHVNRIRSGSVERQTVPRWETQPKVSKEVMDPLNLSLRTRRDRSLTDHVNRIRSGSVERQTVPRRNTQPKYKKKFGAKSSLSKVSHSSKHLNTRVSQASYEEIYYGKTPKVKDSKISIRSKPPEYQISLDSVKEPPKLQSNVSAEDLKIKTETIIEKSPEKTRRKASKKINLVKTRSKQTQPKNFVKSNGPSKDIILLKWLHEINCPISDKINANEMLNVDAGKNKVCPIQILKGPLSKSFNEDDEKEDPIKNPKPKGKPKNQFKKTVKSKTGNTVPLKHSNTTGKLQDFYNNILDSIKASASVPERDILQGKVKENAESLVVDPKETTSEESEESAKFISSHKSTRAIDDVEMYISEPGSLHIVVNLSHIFYEDAAVIVWLDDFPKLVSEFGYRSSLDLTRTAPILERSENLLASQSAAVSEDMTPSAPNICYPPMTILKNVAVDSKVGLTALNEDDADSVYHASCDLSHPNPVDSK